MTVQIGIPASVDYERLTAFLCELGFDMDQVRSLYMDYHGIRAKVRVFDHNGVPVGELHEMFIPITRVEVAS